MMRKFSPLLLLSAGAVMFATSPATASGKILWRNWNDGLREASASQRPVLVDVYTDWCVWCKRMERDVYARADVREYLSRRFVTVKLNAESPAPSTYEGRRLTGASIAARFRVTGYPTTVFLKAGGEHLVNVPGYVDADRFLLLLRYIGDGHLERGVPFPDFVKQSAGTPPDRK